MKKLLSLLLMFTMLVTVTACSNEEIVETDSLEKDENLIDLSLDTFGQIYDLSKEVVISDVLVFSRGELKKESGNVSLKPFTLTHDQFINAYNALLEVQCENSSKNEVVQTKHGFDYIIHLTIEKEGKYRTFHINVGKSYLLITLPSKGTYVYKHELNEDDYLMIKSMLDEMEK